LCSARERALNFEADAAGTGFEVCKERGSAETGTDIDEYVRARYTRLLEGVQNGSRWARQIRHAAARELGIVEGDLIDVPQEIEPRVAVGLSYLRKCSAEDCWRDLAIAQLGSETVRGAPKCWLHALVVAR